MSLRLKLENLKRFKKKLFILSLVVHQVGRGGQFLFIVLEIGSKHRTNPWSICKRMKKEGRNLNLARIVGIFFLKFRMR